MRSRGMRMSGTAVCGPLSAEAQYRRKRRFDDYHIDSEVAGNTIDAWLANGEDAAYNAFNQGFARAYGLTGWDEEETEPDWVFEDMSGLDFRADMTS
ncbi:MULTISPECIES: hypothetical protein [Streptosporangium]|uniref:Uncharacterized protein n=1 Tax=Streptosporangium brasiliense TaxID=47480 RepID=A0ABT9RLZ6_9ACTN|nr:hypothetical protein [Streptosporangium brasiliense]MDP9870317.1 hypothetical protein [Streptosporangium brasiliense]